MILENFSKNPRCEYDTHFILQTSRFLSVHFVLVPVPPSWGSMRCCLWNEACMPPVPPLANWKSHLLTSLAFSRQINSSMNQWKGMNRLRGNGVCTHTRAYQIFTIDMWVTLSITLAKAMHRIERNDFMSEKICYWIQLWLVVRDLDSFCSLVEGWAINLRLTSYWSRKLRGRAFIRLNRLGDPGEAVL